MAFSAFTKEDFKLTGQIKPGSIPDQLSNKIDDLRRELDQFPELKLDFFRNRIRRAPNMLGRDGLIFGRPRDDYAGHWYLYNVRGDQDQVQFNIGMFYTEKYKYIRVGLGFQIGTQRSPKPPAFRVLQTFLGVRPPLPFRDAFYNCVKEYGFQIEDFDNKGADEIINRLETYVIPPDEGTVFIFIGKLWTIDEAITKTATDFREVFLKLMPFYEELILAGGRYNFYPPVSSEA